jgi:hypothetical protein
MTSQRLPAEIFEMIPLVGEVSGCGLECMGWNVVAKTRRKKCVQKFFAVTHANRNRQINGPPGLMLSNGCLRSGRCASMA